MIEIDEGPQPYIRDEEGRPIGIATITPDADRTIVAATVFGGAHNLEAMARWFVEHNVGEGFAGPFDQCEMRITLAILHRRGV